jgi:hypothetical protein
LFNVVLLILHCRVIRECCGGAAGTVDRGPRGLADGWGTARIFVGYGDAIGVIVLVGGGAPGRATTHPHSPLGQGVFGAMGPVEAVDVIFSGPRSARCVERGSPVAMARCSRAVAVGSDKRGERRRHGGERVRPSSRQSRRADRREAGKTSFQRQVIGARRGRAYLGHRGEVGGGLFDEFGGDLDPGHEATGV